MTLGQSQVNLEHGERLTLSKVEGSKLLTINQFASVCRTTPRTLRFYEQKGIFKPAFIDEWSKYRFYDPKQARDFLKIKLMQNFHTPINVILKSQSNATKHLDNKLIELEKEILEKEKEYKFLQKIKYFFTEENPKKLFKTKTFGPFNLFCMKIEHGEYAKITEYIKALWKEAKRLKLNCEDSEITFYLDNRYSPKNTPLEIALVLKDSATMKRLSNKNFYFKSYPKTKTFAYEYTGPYDYLILVYQKLFLLLQTQKTNLKGLVFETYRYGPLNTKSKYDYQTTIGFPI